MAKPRRGPPDRLRGPPRRALRQTAQAPGPEGVHGGAAGGDAHRAQLAQRRAAGLAVAADHQPQERRDPAHRPRSPARSAQPTAPEESCARPLGPGPADRHGHRSRPADGDARRADRGRLTRSAATLRAVGAPTLGRLRLRHEHRHQRRRRRQPRTRRSRPALHRPSLLHDRRSPLGGHPARRRDVRGPRPRDLGRARRPLRRTRRTSAPTTRTCSPNGTRATAGAGC